MAANDLVLIQKIITQTENGVTTTTNGVEEKITLSAFMASVGVAAAAGASGAVIRTAAPAAAAVPFADLTAAANSFNALRTALIAAGVLI